MCNCENTMKTEMVVNGVSLQIIRSYSKFISYFHYYFSNFVFLFNNYMFYINFEGKVSKTVFYN